MRGGVRTRLIGDSLRLVIIDSLLQLGWFDPTVRDDPPGTRTHRPLLYIPTPPDWVHGPSATKTHRDISVMPNQMTISSEDVTGEDRGFGDEVEDRLRFYVDILAESDQLGLHLTRDITDAVIGKMPEIGRVAAIIDVYDLQLATPTPVTTVDVELVSVDRATREGRDWQSHWFMVRIDLVDEYLDEFDANHAEDQWDRYAAAWKYIQGCPPR